MSSSNYMRKLINLMETVNTMDQTLMQQPAVDAAAKIKEALAKLGMTFVTINVGGYKTRVVDRSKALRGGSIGPMTMTDAHFGHCREVQDKVANVMRSMLDGQVEFDMQAMDAYMGGGLLNFDFTIKTGKKTAKLIRFTWRLYQSNHASMEYDRGYKTYWFVMSSENIRI